MIKVVKVLFYWVLLIPQELFNWSVSGGGSGGQVARWSGQVIRAGGQGRSGDRVRCSGQVVR